MNEVKSPKKPLMYYYAIVILVILALNFLAVPWLSQRPPALATILRTFSVAPAELALPPDLEAEVAACHARARHFEDTDWRMIAGLYDRLLAVLPSPVAALNRAVAHAMAFGPETGLALLDALEDEPALKGYAPMAAARGDFLLRAGRPAEARACFEQAAASSGNGGERAFLIRRAEQCAAR